MRYCVLTFILLVSACSHKQESDKLSSDKSRTKSETPQVGDYIAGPCPKCKAVVYCTEGPTHWDGIDPSGAPMGGSFFMAECRSCGSALIANFSGEVDTPTNATWILAETETSGPDKDIKAAQQ